MKIITDLISSVQTTLDSINKTIKKYQSKLETSDRDRKLEIAIKTAKEICNTYDAVQRGIEEALINTTYYDMANGNYRPRYRYWTEFCPDVAINVLHTLKQNYSHAIAHLIKKLEIIIKPFRAHQPEKLTTPSLGLRPYKFSSYANWVQSYPDHQMSYALWRECGFE